MWVLKVRGARNATLAYHRSDNYDDIRELISVYTALGYSPEALIVEEVTEEKAA